MVIVSGSRGVVGQSVVQYLRSKGLDVLELDLVLGHDLSLEDQAIDLMNENPASGLVNCFALNDHADLFQDDGKTPVELDDFSLDLFSRYFQINVTSLFGVCRAFLRRNPSGSIVNFSSIYARVTPRRDTALDRLKHPAYGLSKVAVEHLSRYLAVNGPSEARVNCIRLGGVLRNHSDDFVSQYSARAALGRMVTAKDYLPLVAFLLGDDSKYITGAVISVDSGWTA